MLIVALTLSAACAAILLASRGLLAVPIPPARDATWHDDLLFPWLAGANLLPVMPAMLLLLAIHLTTIHHRLSRLKSAPPAMQERAAAVACYATASLAYLFPAVILSAIFFSLLVGAWGKDALLWAVRIMLLFSIILLPLTLLRILQWILRVRNLGSKFSLLIGPQLIGLWLFALVLDLGILPWCIGLVYLAIDSFR
jgi:hypothetical protein